MEGPDLAGFSAFLLQNGRKQSTVYRHLNCLRLLFKNAPHLSQSEIEAYLLRLKGEGKRHSYLNHFIDTATVYCRFKGLPEPNCHRWADQYFAKATMSDEEIEAFLSLPCPQQRAVHRTGKVFYRATDPKRWERITLFWKICAYTGMRPGEVAHLDVNAVDFGRGVFVLIDTKTEPRLVPIPPNIKEEIEQYCTPLLSKFLFPSARGGNHNGTGPVVDSVDWHYDFKKRIERLGIKRTNLTPYSLRHSLITRLLEEDVNLFKVQKLVGHRRIDTTAQYTHLTTKDIQEAIRKHPLIRKATDPRSILRALLETCNSLFERDERFEKRIEDRGDEVIIRVKIKKDEVSV